MEVPGRFVDARQNGATARLVIDSVPQPIIADRRRDRRRAVEDAGAATSSGETVLQEQAQRAGRSGATSRRATRSRTRRSSPGLDVLAILTVDLDRGMYSLDRDGVMAGAQVVYGSDRQPLRREPPLRARARARQRRARGHCGPRSTASTSPTRRRRSTGHAASVPGFILNNYALSEYDGDLRVASTEEPPWIAGRRRARAQSTVTVLAPGRRAGSIRSASVSGLGQGERIYAVRFMGERATSSRSARSTRCTRSTCRDPTAPEGRRRAEDPRLLRLPAPGRREPAARRRARGRRRQGLAVRRLQPGRAAARSRSCSFGPARRRSRPSRTRSCTGRRRTSR